MDFPVESYSFLPGSRAILDLSYRSRLRNSNYTMSQQSRPTISMRDPQSVNSNTTGTITPMFSSYDRMKPNSKQKAGTARRKWLVRKDWGKLRGVKSLFLSKNIHEK